MSEYTEDGAEAKALDTATGILTAALVHQRMTADEAATYLRTLHATSVQLLTGAAAAVQAEPETVEQPTAAQIRKSIQPDGIVSFIDGKPYKTLKRHLTSNGLTVESYRERYGLPADYPMTAPNYSAARSKLAKSLGLGLGGGGRGASEGHGGDPPNA